MADKWTPELVADRLEEAASTIHRLPSVVPKGYYSFWPDIVHDAMEAYGWDKTVVRLGPPSAGSISRMDEALAWLLWLDPDQVKLVWLRATRMPWKLIVRRFACDRTTAWRKWNLAIHRILSRLEAQEEQMLQHQNMQQVQQNLL